MRPLVIFAAVTLGCASTVSGTRGDAPDAAPDAPVDAPVDAGVTANLELTVRLGQRASDTVGADVPVRVESREGEVVEGRTGADGVFRVAVDPSRTWDVTVAQAGYVAVSLVGARAPLRTLVRLRRSEPLPASRTTTFPVTIRGRSAPRSAVVIEGAVGSTVARDDAVTVAVPTWTGAPEGFWLTGVELDDASNILRGGFAPSPSRTRVAPVELALDQSPRRDVQRLELPVTGRLTAASYGRFVVGSALRFKPVEGGEGAVNVGLSTLAPPSSPADLAWAITRFDGPLAPELVSASFATRDAPTLTATASTRPPFAGLTLAFAPVGEPVTTAAPPRSFRFTAATGAWSRAYFAVRSADGAVRWEGFAVDATPWSEVALPTTPVAPEVIVGRGRIQAAACVLRDAPQTGEAPWSQGSARLDARATLSVCEPGASIDAP